MDITEVATGIKKMVVIKPAQSGDFRLLSKKRFSFAWKSFKRRATIYKLQIDGEHDILGAMGLMDWPADKRMEIKLLASSVENIGRKKSTMELPAA